MMNKIDKDNIHDFNLFFIIGSAITSLFREGISVSDIEKLGLIEDEKINLTCAEVKNLLCFNENDNELEKFDNFLINDLVKIATESNGIGKYSINEINILTPNYDNLIEQTFQKFHKEIRINKYDIKRDFELFNKIEIDKITNFSTPSVNIFKPHGDIDAPLKTKNKGFWINDINPSTINDFNSFEEIRLFRNNLLDKNNSILFVIGYGFNDEYINKIIFDSHKNQKNINFISYYLDSKIKLNSTIKKGLKFKKKFTSNDIFFPFLWERNFK